MIWYATKYPLYYNIFHCIFFLSRFYFSSLILSTTYLLSLPCCCSFVLYYFSGFKSTNTRSETNNGRSSLFFLYFVSHSVLEFFSLPIVVMAYVVFVYIFIIFVFAYLSCNLYTMWCIWEWGINKQKKGGNKKKTQK